MSRIPSTAAPTTRTPPTPRGDAPRVPPAAAFIPAQGLNVIYILPNERVKRPAVITRIRSNGTLDLHVLTCAKRDSEAKPCFNALEVLRDLTGQIPGTWHPIPQPRLPDGVQIADAVVLPPETGPAPVVDPDQLNLPGVPAPTPAPVVAEAPPQAAPEPAPAEPTETPSTV